MPHWKFEEKTRRQKTRNPMQASFFTNASIEDDTHALVREALQNSLDARIKTNTAPVRVRFVLGVLKPRDPVLERYFSAEAWKHFRASDNGLSYPPDENSECKYLVFEDFNTTGLIGDETAHEAEKENAFYFFMRAEGQSGKDEGDRGRHGIGKYVFPYTSRIRAFIAATVRSDDKRHLIAGQSILNFHTVDSKPFTPDGWWGEFEQTDGFQLPVESPESFATLVSDFGLSRTVNDSGLSLIMPFVSDDISAELLSKWIIAEYFMPLMQGKLVAEVIKGSKRIAIDETSIRNDLDSLVQQEDLDTISSFIELAKASIDLGSVVEINLKRPDTEQMPVWNQDLIDKETAVKIGKALSTQHAVVCLKVPVSVKRKNQPAEWSIFRMYIRRETGDERRKPLFVREGITIPEDGVGKIRGYTCMAVIDEGPLATLLGDSENPAHTEWERNAVKFREKGYQWGPTTINFVRLSFGKLFGLLAQADEEEDRDVLSDIFYLDLPDNDDDNPSQDIPTPNDSDGVVDPPPPPPPPPPRTRHYKLSRIKGGFSITGSETAAELARRFRVRVAYDVENATKVKALRDYHKNDFVLDKKNTSFENLEWESLEGQTAIFTTTDNSFRFEATGFDPNRDLIIDVDPRALVDETL